MGPHYVGEDYAYTIHSSNTTGLGQYLGVVQTATEECDLPAALTDVTLGVTQEEATADDVTKGRAVNVRTRGSSWLVAGAAIALNQKVAVGTDGKGVVAAAGNNVIGICRLAATAAGQLIIVQLTPGLVA